MIANRIMKYLKALENDRNKQKVVQFVIQSLFFLGCKSYLRVTQNMYHVHTLQSVIED